MANGRCRMHGGASTGPKTAEGKARIAAAQARRGDPVRRAMLAQTTVIQRRGRILVATAKAGLPLEALAEPIQTVLGGTEPLPEIAGQAAAFVYTRLMGHDLTHAETRVLVGAIREIGRQQPIRRERSDHRTLAKCQFQLVASPRRRKSRGGTGMPGLTRRQTIGAIASAGIVSRAARADMAALEDAANREGTLTWYIAQMSSEVAELMGRRFTARYPGVKVVAIRTTGQVAHERLQQELKNNAPQCDVFSSTDIAHYPALRKRGALAQYVPMNVGELAPAFRGLGEDGYYYPTSASLQMMIYQKEKVAGADIPRRFTDMLDPKWKGRVATGHPAFSGYFGQLAVVLRRQYGWEFFEKLAKNNPRIGRSGGDPLTMLNAGECLIGTSAMSIALQSADHGNPIGLVFPEDGSLLCVGPSAILAAAPHTPTPRACSRNGCSVPTTVRPAWTSS